MTKSGDSRTAMRTGSRHSVTALGLSTASPGCWEQNDIRRKFHVNEDEQAFGAGMAG
jgi:hypothetical protein